VQRDDAAERRCCTIRASLAQDDVIDVLRSHPGALHDGIDHGGSQIFYWDVAEDPAVAADWGAQRGAQDNVIIVLVGHRSLLSRSEEHTSELQSRFDLVCRLLLEKKKKKKIEDTH